MNKKIKTKNMGLDQDPSLKQFEADAKDVTSGDKGTDNRDIETVTRETADRVLDGSVLTQSDAGKKGDEAKAKESHDREEKEAKARSEEEARLKALDQTLGVTESRDVVDARISTADKAPEDAEKAAQQNVKDKKKDVAERSGNLMKEGSDSSER